MTLRLNFLKSKYGCAFMLLSDFAKKNHITRQRSHQYIQEKRIKNAVRMGCRWYIPANTVVKKRRPWAKRYKKLNRYEPTFYWDAGGIYLQIQSLKKGVLGISCIKR